MKSKLLKIFFLLFLVLSFFPPSVFLMRKCRHLLCASQVSPCFPSCSHHSLSPAPSTGLVCLVSFSLKQIAFNLYFSLESTKQEAVAEEGN